MDLAIASDARVGGSAIPTKNFVLCSLLFQKKLCHVSVLVRSSLSFFETVRSYKFDSRSSSRLFFFSSFRASFSHT